MEVIKPAVAGHETVFAVDAVNWPSVAGVECIKIGVAKPSFEGRAERGLRHMLGQFYGVLDPGLILAEHVFRGLNREMHVGENEQAASEKLAVTWAATRDAKLVGDKQHSTLEYLGAPESKVFAVYISINKMLSEYPSIYGWAEHWTWLQADPVLSGAPIQWEERYDARIWSRLIEADSSVLGDGHGIA